MMRNSVHELDYFLSLTSYSKTSPKAPETVPMLPAYLKLASIQFKYGMVTIILLQLHDKPFPYHDNPLPFALK